ncbi:Glycoside hydrolase family 28 [Penicillium cf. griseofulvum]|uniref:endo-polygalacturonase n=1 Tax=Penicillium cf. griseofulvum TaxID=2972120 RepID=A0A9W9M9D3_9EURO|nr:Glycoside hydrolase family 28 [Penicillium cf. griseofulvum]KAJ5445378.1 Glycoside hydrolase family 28 [Penicillium cf. griseofulvum]
MRTSFISMLALGAVVSAAPAPSRVSEIVERSSSTCTFNSAASAIASKKSCSTIVLDNIAVPAGKTLDLSNLKEGTKVIFKGETTFGYKEWKGPLIRFSGSNIEISGEEGHLINGDGARWWDTKGSNGGKDKPKFFYAHSLDHSSITGLNVKNTPVQAFSVQADNLVLDHITIDNTDGDKNGGHNTDAFDVGESTYITISNANIKNQDDCLAVNSGENIVFTGGYCSGGHGISIGSVGGRDNNIVKNVTISDSTVTNSANGVRVKTVYKATGSVSDVTFSNIELSKISSYGIVIEQDYENGSPTGKPTTGVPITGLTVEKVTGTVESSATDIFILCGTGSCSDWTWTGNAITGGDDEVKYAVSRIVLLDAIHLHSLSHAQGYIQITFKMHVLLLGGHGKVALHLTPLLLNRGWSVTSVVRNPSHESEILSLGQGLKGTIKVLLSSLEDVKSPSDAQRIIDTVAPDYVVWSAGAGGKGGPARTIAIDQEAAKHFIAASFAAPSISKFLMVSYLGSRRKQPSWMPDDQWAGIVQTNTEILPTYAKAKQEADEYMTALAAQRKHAPGPTRPFQAINLRPGILTDQPATRKVELGITPKGRGSVTREDVAIVADLLLARADTEGWIDLVNGEEEVEEAVERVAREKVDAVVGEDVEGMVKKFFP